jgi:hypothetical protein
LLDPAVTGKRLRPTFHMAGFLGLYTEINAKLQAQALGMGEVSSPHTRGGRSCGSRQRRPDRPFGGPLVPPHRPVAALNAQANRPVRMAGIDASHAA